MPTLSKIYKYFDEIFSKYLCGFRKGQNSSLFMLQLLRKSLDKGCFTGVLLTDLSKAFDCISHELLIAKLHAYGFSILAIKLINDYLCNRYQHTKIGNKFSTWNELIYGIPHRLSIFLISFFYPTPLAKNNYVFSFYVTDAFSQVLADN